MCSNINNNSYGDRNEHSGSCLKKQKKDKVPRRGPGVAELEKILREQENKCTVVSDSCPSLFSSSNPSSAITDRCLVSHPIHLPPPPVSALYSSSNNHNNSHSRVSARPNSEMEDSRNFSGFPFLWNGLVQNDLIHSLPVFQRKQQMMNLHQHIVMQPLSSPQSSGLYQFVEPPSNQRSCHNDTSQWLDEEKMVGVKRPRPFLVDSPPTNPKSNTGLTDKISRDIMHSSSSDVRLKSFVSDYDSTSVNSSTIGSSSSATPSTWTQVCTRDFLNSKFIPRHIQYEQKESFEEYVHQRSAMSVSSHQKPFYRFLQSEEQKTEESNFGFNNERSETNGDHGIDLSLKL